MRKHIKYLKMAGTVSLLTALIIIGAVLNVSKSRAAVGTVTLTVDSSDVKLGGRAVFTGSIPTGDSATVLTSVTINLAPTTSQATQALLRELSGVSKFRGPIAWPKELTNQP